MRILSTFRLFLVAMIFPISLVLPRIVVAQDTGLISDSEYVLTYGATLSWADPWVVNEEESGFTTEQLGDFVSLQASDTAFVQFATLPAVGDLPSFVQNIAGNVAGSNGEVLDSDADKREGFAYVRVMQGTSEFAYAIFAFRTEDLSTERALILITEPGTVGEWITSIQETFLLDDEPLLPTVDATEVQDLFGAADAAEEDPANADDKKLPDDATDDTDAETGLIGDRAYESPQWGTAIEWNQRWIADQALATSDSSEGIDYFSLARRGGDAALYFSMRDGADTTPDEWMSTFIDGIASDDDFAVLDTATSADGAWVLYTRDVDGTEVLGYIEAYSENVVLIVSELSGPVAEREFGRVFDAAQASVTIDGDAPFRLTDEAPEVP